MIVFTWGGEMKARGTMGVRDWMAYTHTHTHTHTESLAKAPKVAQKRVYIDGSAKSVGESRIESRPFFSAFHHPSPSEATCS